MLKKIRLFSGLLEGDVKVDDKSGHLDKPVMLVYAGKFESMDGPVEIKDEDIEKLAANHNSKFEQLQLAHGDGSVKGCPPIQLDHSTSATHTVGRLVGGLTVGEHTPAGGKPVKALLGTCRFLGADNIEKVMDGRWQNVSMGADMEGHELSELTITPFPAAAEATLLSKNKLSTEEKKMGYKDTKEKADLYAKCKKHLMDEKKMSEEDSDKHLEALDDEGVKKMAAEEDERSSKLAADEDEKAKKLAADEEEKKKSELSRLAALEEPKKKMIALNKNMIAHQKKVQLARKKVEISTRLSKLRADGKVTPAEVKKMNLEEMAGQDQAVIDATLKSYSDREPVIDTGLHGTIKALSAGQITSRLKKMTMEREELQTRLNMPSKRDEALKRLAELDMSEAEANKLAAETPAPDGDFEKLWGDIKGMMDGARHEDAKEHLRKHLTALAIPRNTDAAPPAEDQTQDLSALADGMKNMQTEFESITKLCAPLLGITPEELV